MYVDTMRLLRKHPLSTWGVMEIEVVIDDLNRVLTLRDILKNELAKRSKN